MRLSNISIGNLRRRKGKTFLLVSGLTIGVAMVVAMLGITLAMQEDLDKKLDEYGANIVIVPKSEQLALSYGGVSVTDTAFDVEELNNNDVALISQIENKKNLSAVAPKVMGAYKYGERSLLIVGIDFKSEFKIKKWWRLADSSADHMPGFVDSPATEANELVVGSAAAASLGLKHGDTLMMGDKSYVVKGVLKENASQDDFAVFMRIDEAQRLLGKPGAVSMIEVSALCADCPIDDIVAQISAKLPHAKVSAVRQAMTLKMQTVDQMVRFSIAVSVVVLLIGSLIVFVSMLSSVNERTKEIGVLRAIGFRQCHVMRIILLEAFAVSLVSGVMGWVLGSVSTTAIAPQFTGASALSFDPLMLGASVALAILVGMASSVYPALKASRLDPLEALRYI